MTKWQKIETAPKDGTTIIVYRPKIVGTIEHISDDYWSVKYEFWSRSNQQAFPTHWMPMPKPPTNDEVGL